MRILVLCYEYPPIGGGGGRVAQTIAESLAARGHEVRVQTAALALRSRTETIRGVHIHRTASGRRSPEHCRVHEMALYVATSFLPALAQCRHWRPEVIHAHFAVPTGLLALALHRLTGIPYVLTAHLGDVPGGVPAQTDHLFRLIGPLARRIWRSAAAATAVSGFVRELAERAYLRHVVCILNGIDLTGRPSPPSAALAEPPELLFLGRLNRQKNAPLLIEALAQIVDLPWRLTIVGDGPDLPAVQERIAAHHLGPRVTLTGWLSAEKVSALLGRSSVLCMPSSSEGLPVAAIEALKHGLAIAGTDIPGLSDVLTSGENGLAAAPNDAAAFASILRALIESPARLLLMRQASWKKAEQFALPAITSQYDAVLSQAAHSTPAPPQPPDRSDT